MANLGCVGPACYWLVKKSTSFEGAGPACAMVNSTSLVLGSIPNDLTNTYLTSRINQHGGQPYIGAIAKTFPWRWITGEALNGDFSQLKRLIIGAVCVHKHNAIWQLHFNCPLRWGGGGS